MARVKEYQQQTSVGHLPGSPRATPSDEFARALVGIGEAGMRAAETMARRDREASDEAERRARILKAEEDRRETVRAHVEMADFELGASQAQQQLADQDAENPWGHGERVAADFDARAEKMLGKFQNEAARSYAREHVANARTRHLLAAMQFERGQIVRKEGRDFERVVDARSASAAASDADYNVQAEAIEAAGVMLNQPEAVREKARGVLAYRTAEGLVARDPSAAAVLLGQRLGMDRGPTGLTADERAQWASLPAGDREAYAEAVRRARAAPGKQTVVVSGTVPAEPAGEPGKTGVDWVDRLSVEQAISLRARAEAGTRDGRARAQREIHAAEADATAAAHRGEVGAVPSREAYVAAFGEQDGAEQYRRAAQIPEFGRQIAALSGATIEAHRAVLSAPLPGPGAPAGDYAEAAKWRDITARASAHLIERRQRDWMTAVGQERIARIGRLDWGDPREAEAELRRRQPVAKMAPPYTGAAAPAGVLTRPESEAFQRSWPSIDSMSRAGTLRLMRDALDDQATLRATIQQIAPDSAVVMAASSLVGQAGERPMTIAARLLRGDDLLNPNKQARTEDGKPVGKTVPLPADFNARLDEALGDSLAFLPGSQQAARQVVAAYYTALASEAGLYTQEGAKSASADLIARAVEDTIGPVVGWAGLGRVIGPWGMTADQTSAALRRAWAEMRDSPNAPDLDVSRTRLVADPNAQGRYFVAAGERLVSDKAGRRVVLDIRPPTMPRDLPAQVPR